MIKNIIFDMGQVLIHWQPTALMTRLSLSEEDHALLLREVFQSVEWVQLDRGSISEANAVKDMCCRLPAHLHSAVEEMVTAWWKPPLDPMPGMGELIRELKENGYGIYLLSNAGTPLRTYFPRIPGSDCFDGLLVSSEHRLIKPQHEIYEKLYETFDLIPGECFFIDDSPANIEGALETGMPGVIFRGDVPALRRMLIQNGIRCRE